MGKVKGLPIDNKNIQLEMHRITHSHFKKEKMIDKIFENNGFWIGFLAGILKIMQDLRNAKFRWLIAITDLSASTIVGYSVYVWASESNQLANWQVIGLTIMFSLNAFVVIKIITEPTVVRNIIQSWFKIDLENNNNKQNK